MNASIFENHQLLTKFITQKIKSLVPADFPIALNQIMTGQSLTQAKAITLLLQKNIELEKLVDIKTLQTQMRDMARRFLDDYLPKIMATFTDIVGFCHFFDSYYLDIFTLLTTCIDADENEKTGTVADIAEAIQDLSSFIMTKKNKSNELLTELQKYNGDQHALNNALTNTQKIAEQLYIGEETEIKALQILIKDLAKEINEHNTQIANGALPSAKNTLKIATSLITEYLPDKKSQTKDMSKPDLAPETKEIKMDPTPILSGNIQIFSDNKPVPSLYQEKLQTTLAIYRKNVEKLKKYNIEASVYTALIQEWDNFSKNLGLVEACIKYLSVAWQGLTENFTLFKQKISLCMELNVDDIEYMQQQWSLTRYELAALYGKAIYFQNNSHLEVITTTNNYDRNLLGIPRVKNSRFMQKIIAKKSTINSPTE